MRNSDKPLTKSELDSAITASESRLRSEMQEQGSDIREEMAGMETRLREELNTKTSNIIEHFNFVAEQIRSDISRANDDEISSLNDKLADHDQRISRLEKLN